MIKAVSPAKINCFLYVTGKRADGYHEILSLMARINLYDDIELSEADITSVQCDHPDVPQGDLNIAYRAARLFYERAGNHIGTDSPPGIMIKITKRIPVGAGLGGGSSNAATILLALNALHGQPVSSADLMEMGLSLGSDVPFFISGRAAIVTGIGEKIEHCGPMKPCDILLMYPGIIVSTAAVYKNVDLTLTQKRRSGIEHLLKICREESLLDVAQYLHNDLQQAAFRIYPAVLEAKKEMESVLARQVCMSGSGSSLFALFTDHDEAKEAYSRLSHKLAGRFESVFLTSFR